MKTGHPAVTRGTSEATGGRKGQRYHNGVSSARANALQMDLKVRCLAAIEQELHETLGDQGPASTEFPRMLYYHMGWDDEAVHSTVAAKRIRPLLTLLCAAAAGGEWEVALPLAASVELVHSFSLVHDDIQDASPVRRGRPSVWARWGVAQAINVGDALFARASLAVLRPSRLLAETRVDALRSLGQACLALCAGQYLDVMFESQPSVTTEQYIEMIEGKTASLIATATELGALAASASGAVRSHYRTFGLHLGLAFQIRDDILGIWGDVATIGKSAQSDIETRKKTLPVVYALARSALFREAYRSLDTSADHTASIVRMLAETGAREYAEAEERRYADLALRCLADARPQGEAASVLHRLTLQLLGRVR